MGVYLTHSLTLSLSLPHTLMHSLSYAPTWLPVSMQDRLLAVVVFQKRMQRSAVPPPDASSPC